MSSSNERAIYVATLAGSQESEGGGLGGGGGGEEGGGERGREGGKGEKGSRKQSLPCGATEAEKGKSRCAPTTN